MLTDVGSLEFRILANRKHDEDVDRAGARARRPGQAAVAVQVGPARRDLDRHQSHDSPTIPSPTRSRTGRKTSTPGPRST